MTLAVVCSRRSDCNRPSADVVFGAHLKRWRRRANADEPERQENDDCRGFDPPTALDAIPQAKRVMVSAFLYCS
jgi:hypothetical protein